MGGRLLLIEYNRKLSGAWVCGRVKPVGEGRGLIRCNINSKFLFVGVFLLAFSFRFGFRFSSFKQ